MKTCGRRHQHHKAAGVNTKATERGHQWAPGSHPRWTQHLHLYGLSNQDQGTIVTFLVTSRAADVPLITFLYSLSNAGQQGMSHCGKIWSAICLDMDLCPNSCLHGLRNINTEVQQQVFKNKAYKEERKLTQYKVRQWNNVRCANLYFIKALKRHYLVYFLNKVGQIFL